jgi:hypothetical protein
MASKKVKEPTISLSDLKSILDKMYNFENVEEIMAKVNEFLNPKTTEPKETPKLYKLIKNINYGGTIYKIGDKIEIKDEDLEEFKKVKVIEVKDEE